MSAGPETPLIDILVPSGIRVLPASVKVRPPSVSHHQLGFYFKFGSPLTSGINKLMSSLDTLEKQLMEKVPCFAWAEDQQEPDIVSPRMLVYSPELEAPEGVAVEEDGASYMCFWLESSHRIPLAVAEQTAERPLSVELLRDKAVPVMIEMLKAAGIESCELVQIAFSERAEQWTYGQISFHPK